MDDDRRLRAATTIAAVETAALILLVVARNGGRTPLLLAALALKFPFCFLARHRHAGGFLGLVLWEGVGGFVALVGRGIPLGVRIAEIAAATTVVWLLVTSAHLFPTPRLPER